MAANNTKFKDRGFKPKNKRGRRGNDKDRSTQKDSIRDTYPKSDGDNDLSWHAKSGQLLADSASIPWSWSTGVPIRRSRGADSQRDTWLYTLPGLHVMRTVIIPGAGDKHSDAVNIAAQALYTDIRRELKSANQYDPADVMIYILAVGEVMANISFQTRIVGTAMKYSFENSFMPDDLLTAQGVDSASIKQHVAEYRSRLNQLIAKASQIWIPKGFSFLERCKWEYANYYSEGPSAKDQIYFFTPAVFRKFRMLEEADYAGGLIPFAYVPDSPSDELLTWEDLCDILDQQIEALVGDSDFHNIAGDLFNRYGAGGVETFMLIPDSAINVTAYSYEVLEQMQNAVCLPQVYNIYYHPVASDNRDKFFSVYQDEVNGVIVVPNRVGVGDIEGTWSYQTEFEMARHANPILTVHDSPSPAKTMLITRLTNVVKDFILDGAINILDGACEWVISFDLYYHDASTGALQFDRYDSFMLESTNFNRTFARLSAFHYHPLVTLWSSDGSTVPYLFGEQDVIALIDSQQVADINRVDMMSMFAVPDVGSVKG